MLGGPATRTGVEKPAASDSMSGGPGDDFLADGEPSRGAQNALSGGSGDDLLAPINKPAGKDIVSCGSGRDKVFADRADVIAEDCEKVFFRLPRDSDF